ncbi:MAG: hypothetical protein OXG19_09655 [Chloroflexi bacterium]|nr:hypothetical protein [Chloroflexota bacterium]
MLNLLDRFDHGTRARGTCEYALTNRGVEHVEGCLGCDERWWNDHDLSSIRGGFELNDLDQPTMTLSPVPTAPGNIIGVDSRLELHIDDIEWV